MNIQTFSYDSLPDTSKVIVQQRTSEIKTLMRKTASDIIEIGHKLIEVKEELEHGQFGNWLESEFGWTDRTARNFMNVATRFKTEMVSDLSFAPSALYMLSSPSTPDEAVQEAVKRAEAGERVTKNVAENIKKKHTGPEIIPEYEEEAQEIIDLLDEEGPDIKSKKSPKEYIDRMLHWFCIEFDVPVLEVSEIAKELEEIANR